MTGDVCCSGGRPAIRRRARRRGVRRHPNRPCYPHQKRPPQPHNRRRLKRPPRQLLPAKAPRMSGGRKRTPLLPMQAPTPPLIVTVSPSSGQGMTWIAACWSRRPKRCLAMPVQTIGRQSRRRRSAGNVAPGPLQADRPAGRRSIDTVCRCLPQAMIGSNVGKPRKRAIVPPVSLRRFKQTAPTIASGLTSTGSPSWMTATIWVVF